MKHLLTITVSVAALALASPSFAAKCSEEDPGGTRVAAARAAIQATCTCDSTAPADPNHGDYVKCAKTVAKDRAGLLPGDVNFLPKSCRGAVIKCAAKSTCGKPGFVTCCKQKKNGDTKCSLKKSAQKCIDKGGTPGECPSCCDSCTSAPAGGGPAPCVPAPTTTNPPPTTTTSPPPTTTTLPDGGTLLNQ